jgi:hypothetical protein
VTNALLRQWHTYLGALIAPSVLFFTLTGIVQIFNLHEAHDGYTPFAVVAELSKVHKDQVFEMPEHHPAPPAPAPPATAAPTPAAQGASAAPDEGDRLPTTLLKWFFAFVAVSLAGSTCIGIWMAFTYPRRRRAVASLLAVGVVIPVVLAMI